MKLFNEITYHLKNSGQTWSELNTALGNKNKSALQSRIKRHITFINSVLEKFGFELSIKPKSDKLIDIL